MTGVPQRSQHCQAQRTKRRSGSAFSEGYLLRGAVQPQYQYFFRPLRLTPMAFFFAKIRDTTVATRWPEKQHQQAPSFSPNLGTLFK